MDANFAAYYDEIENKYYYYIQRLVGIEVDFKVPVNEVVSEKSDES